MDLIVPVVPGPIRMMTETALPNIVRTVQKQLQKKLLQKNWMLIFLLKIR